MESTYSLFNPLSVIAGFPTSSKSIDINDYKFDQTTIFTIQGNKFEMIDHKEGATLDSTKSYFIVFTKHLVGSKKQAVSTRYAIYLWRG